MKTVTRRALLGMLATACTAVAAQVPASKMVTLIVPYPPGGPADVSARLASAIMRRSLGETIVIDNASGSSGALGVHKVLSAPPDGRVMLFGTSSDVILAPITLSAVKHRPEQLRLVGMTNRTPFLLVSGMQLPPQKLANLLAAARKPGAKPLNYASIGHGSLPHLISEDFAARANVKMTHIPYKGVTPMVQDLIGGQVELGFVPVAGSTVDMVLQGKLRAYAVTANERLARLPDVPTVSEATGIHDFNFEIWGSIFVPRSVPLEASRRLNAAVNDTVADSEFRSQIEAAGSTVGPRMTLDEAERFFSVEVARYRGIARRIRLEPQ